MGYLHPTGGFLARLLVPRKLSFTTGRSRQRQRSGDLGGVDSGNGRFRDLKIGIPLPMNPLQNGWARLLILGV